MDFSEWITRKYIEWRGSALQLLRHGADAVTVMRLLGHADLKTTLRYLAQTADDLHDVHRRASPLENIDD